MNQGNMAIIGGPLEKPIVIEHSHQICQERNLGNSWQLCGFGSRGISPFAKGATSICPRRASNLQSASSANVIELKTKSMSIKAFPGFGTKLAMISVRPHPPVFERIEYRLPTFIYAVTNQPAAVANSLSNGLRESLDFLEGRTYRRNDSNSNAGWRTRYMP